jgi:hypothetical protein
MSCRNEGGNGLGITGIHDMDTKWLSDVKHAATAGSSSGNDDTDSSEKKQMCVDDEGDEYECSDSSSSSSTSGASTAGDDDQESSLKILPRVAIEASIADEAAVVEIAEKLNELRLSHGFHGFTIESSLHEFPQTVSLLK